jgi:murein DD-endopeptidase MepM/ murein hydrolase activator NlpD
VIIEYPYQVVPDQVREDFDMTSNMSMYVQYQHLDEIAPQIVAGRAVTANDAIGQYGNTGASLSDHLHLEVHIGPSQQLGMGRNDGTYDTHQNNWHDGLVVSDPNYVWNIPR